MKLNIENKYCQPDPYVIKSGNKYYMYASGDSGVRLNVSSDRYNWEYKGNCFFHKGMFEYWAPTVIELDGVFYMYVSFRPDGEEDPHQEHIICATSSNPEGPFEYKADIYPPFSIDPHVVKSGNELFIFYSVNDYEAERAGTYIVVDKLLDPFTPANNPKRVVVPSIDEEIFLKDRFKKGQHWHTIEGALYFRKGDYHYLMYSANCYQNVNYFVGYSVAYGHEDDLTKLDFKKYPDDKTYAPLLRKNDEEEGTGHNSVLEDNGRFFIYYHGRDLGILLPGVEQRTARAIEVLPQDGKLVLKKLNSKEDLLVK